MSDIADSGAGGNGGEGGTGRAGSGSRRGFDMDDWWEDRSLGQKIIAGIGFAVLGAGLLALFGWVVMLLWNWLLPDIFGLKRIGYWQAWGLLALCTILFKGIGSGGNGGGGRSDRKRKQHLRRQLREDQGGDHAAAE
jgi:hypothetical protein